MELSRLFASGEAEWSEFRLTKAHGGRASFGRREASQQAWNVARFPRVVMLGLGCFEAAKLPQKRI